ncbi:hypothetical protein [Bacteroides timonensis]|uniref:hypothetical protein n=1 Tax=Bacteroides timonensis TaxID=1470345 RepID=UPI0004B97FA5|nr:hypothetical protein [Bacteroides timonensis]
MKVYHQLGFRDKWNIDCYGEGFGDGLIFSPINMESNKLLALPTDIRANSFLDPQMYLLSTEKSSNVTYPFFPGNIKAGFSTSDLDTANEQIAELCIDYQMEANFKYIVIPTRYFEATPTKYLEQTMQNFVIPFLDYKEKKNINASFLLTVIVKQCVLEDQTLRDELLNWMTGIAGITGFYLIFENNFASKQIKDFAYLSNALFLIDILKKNEMEVHIGYNNTEGLLFSAAMPDSIAIGSYENLRMFKISRFEVLEGKVMRSPNARLYSSRLLQWIEYNYIDSMKMLVDDYDKYFDDTKYKPLMFNIGDFKNKEKFKWHFSKSEIYKHYFEVFSSQVHDLPSLQEERIEFLKANIMAAIENFKIIKANVLLDSDSDDSHLAIWYNVLNAYKKSL